MTRNYSTTVLAFLVFAVLLLTFPSKVRSEENTKPAMVAQVGSAVIGAVNNNPESFADDEFSDDMWGDSEDHKAAYASDPWQGYNRAMFKFNDYLYFNIMKPVTQGYMWLVPLRPRTWTNNFFQNMLYPVRLTSCLLQGKFYTAGAETSKFVANSIFGMGGLGNVVGDAQSTMPLYMGEEDMGQTFGVWGIPNGPYFVLPFLGPSTIRDAAGVGIDTFVLNPFWWFGIPWYYSVSAGTYNQINKLSFHIGEYESLKEGSIDPYLALRDAYLSYRAKQVRDSKISPEGPEPQMTTDPDAVPQK
ncbi:VacJ family lipoprotein [Maridesulfovibrio sp.]|uniref:MlaA family lipoprotein n=1 Tax=Maridesulfovibrio sp. TaxID=2795000 RepID=UPI0029C9B3BF|nr:VacJ family lipoprotein [Maridesulfovibrio sp.]